MPKRIRVLSLFSGAGGLDLGLLLAGQVAPTATGVIYGSNRCMMQTSPYFDIVGAIEWDVWGAKSYARNVGDHVINADIQTVDPVRWAGQIDLIIGGPPCQDYSIAGKRAGKGGDRGRLVDTYTECVRVIRPPAFLMENVRGLISSKVEVEQITTTMFDITTTTTKVSVLDYLLAQFAAIGYRCEWRVLNLADYGVPQARVRVFIFGVRDDQPTPPFCWPKQTHSEQGTMGLLCHEACGQYLENLPAIAPAPATAAWQADGHPDTQQDAPSLAVADLDPIRDEENWVALGNLSEDTRRWVTTTHPVNDPDQPACTITGETANLTSGNSIGLWREVIPTAEGWLAGKHPASNVDAPANTVTGRRPSQGGTNIIAMTPQAEAWLESGSRPPSAPEGQAQMVLATHARTGVNTLMLKNRFAEHTEGFSVEAASPTVLGKADLELLVRNRFSELGEGSLLNEPSPTVVSRTDQHGVGNTTIQSCRL